MRAIDGSSAISTPLLWRACGRGGTYARSFCAVVLPAHEPANGYAERSCQRRQDPLVGGFAGFQALDRAREDAGGCRQFVDAVTACNAEAEDTR